MRNSILQALLVGLPLMAATMGVAQDTPAPRVFDTIEVIGNQRFRDGDVIATSGLSTGVEIARDDLVAAVEALEFTGEFEDVRIRSSGETLIIEVDETPGYTGGLGFGLGYDSDTGIFGAASLGIENAFGNGTNIDGSIVIAEEVRTLGLSFGSDTFWPRDIAGGIRIELEDYDYENTTYDYKSARIEPFAYFSINSTLASELRFMLTSKEISSVDPDASPIIAADEGRETAIGFGYSLIARSELNEVTGDRWAIRFNQDISGIGGDENLIRTELQFSGRKAIGTRGFAVRSRVEVGAVTGFDGDQPRVSDRFALGGASLRGFERGTVAPRDICTGCGAGGEDITTILGGHNYATARTDVLVPLFPNRPTIETFAFVDVGSVWEVDTDVAPDGTLTDGREWRTSAGIGTSITSDFGNLELYWALETDGEDGDEEQEFGLTFRARF